MPSSWPSGARSGKAEAPPPPHACVAGLAISTCPRCAGHPQGYRNPICEQCKGCGVVTEPCRQCLLNTSTISSANTSQMTSPATSCSADGSVFEQRMRGRGPWAYETSGNDENVEKDKKGLSGEDSSNKDQAS